ncbi:MAG TPA: hypothetical protein VJX67_09015 [Blastocatellia bacterium]|nr:hypothetical protein [Blastocatellia bacterium]
MKSDTKAGWLARLARLVSRGEVTDAVADRLVAQALDCDLDEPESFVRVLLFLSDLHEQGREPQLSRRSTG